MTVLNGVVIPEFNNFEEVQSLIEANSDKIFLHFLEDDGKIERNAILSHNEAENTEFNQITTYHCMCCNSMDDFISSDGYCQECNPEDDEDEYN